MNSGRPERYGLDPSNSTMPDVRGSIYKGNPEGYSPSAMSHFLIPEQYWCPESKLVIIQLAAV